MKKLTTVVALALTAVFQAQAVEGYKNDTSLLDLYDRIYVGHFFGDKKEGVDVPTRTALRITVPSRVPTSLFASEPRRKPRSREA